MIAKDCPGHVQFSITADDARPALIGFNTEFASPKRKLVSVEGTFTANPPARGNRDNLTAPREVLVFSITDDHGRYTLMHGLALEAKACGVIAIMGTDAIRLA